MTFPTISRRSLFTGIMKSRLTVWNGKSRYEDTLSSKNQTMLTVCLYMGETNFSISIQYEVLVFGGNAPFFPRGHTTHAMQPIQDGL